MDGSDWPRRSSTHWPAYRQKAKVFGPPLERLVDWLVERDVLRWAPRQPRSAPDAWSALAELLASLDESDLSSLGQAIDRCRWLCVRLAHEFDELPPEQVEGCLTAIEAEIQQLWR